MTKVYFLLQPDSHHKVDYLKHSSAIDAYWPAICAWMEVDVDSRGYLKPDLRKMQHEMPGIGFIDAHCLRYNGCRVFIQEEISASTAQDIIM